MVVAITVSGHSSLCFTRLNRKTIKLMNKGTMTTRIGKCSDIYLPDNELKGFLLFAGQYFIFFHGTVLAIYPDDKCQGDAEGSDHDDDRCEHEYVR